MSQPFPSAAATLPATPSETTPPRLRRFACMMYEAVLLFGVVFLAGYLFDTLTQSRSGMMYRHGRQAWLFFALGVYFISCWRRNGQTLPMKTWNIRLVDRDGQPPSMARLILRYLLAWLLPLAAAGAILAATLWSGWPTMQLLIVAAPFAVFIGSWLDRDGQFLHDRLAGTRLVNAAAAKTKSIKSAVSM
ncbi:RDD family protein [Bordetella genomosp. 10]|uniref:RDD family protein n=1 Tax=Bordetella genomosp. 10 TaxID=1416804 RepID=A0A261RZM5_9BORD|nr:RDD family protein [Bordetella genomosp. 10]OZI30365.1 RDD family protein [Bordetella genomosp. 10]